MKINHQRLIKLPVITESGQRLGRIKSFNIDIETQSILEYEIKPDSLIKELIDGDLFVSRGQVVDINTDRLIVKDGFSAVNKFKKIDKILSKKKESMVLNKN